jgi:hypothetical protein
MVSESQLTALPKLWENVLKDTREDTLPGSWLVQACPVDEPDLPH